MKLLEDRIKKDGIVLPGNILKVNSFLNHQIDVELLDKLAEDFKKSFDGVDITKIVTIEASGIAVACSVARAFGNIPVLFAKKHTSAALSDDVYYSTVWSHTNSCNYNIVISREYLSSDDKILLVDDFLANGNAMKGLIEIAENRKDCFIFLNNRRQDEVATLNSQKAQNIVEYKKNELT